MKKAAAILICAIFGLTAAACARVYKADDTVFDSELQFSVRMYGGDTEKAYEEMLALMDRLAASADTTDPNSVVSRVNAAPVGEAVETDGIFCELTAAATELYRETDGAFNVFLRPLSVLWGVDAESVRDYVPTAANPSGSSPASLPAAAEIDPLMAAARPESFVLTEHEAGGTLVKTAAVEFDFGGLAKGWAVDRCREIAEKYGVQSAQLDLSGNLILLNRYFDEKSGAFTDWTVGITDPRPEDLLFRYYVMAFRSAGDVSIVTSGDYERYYYYPYENRSPVRVSHIIGRDGVPAGLKRDADGTYSNAEHVISATVVGESSMRADAYATAVCVMGLTDGAAFLEEKGYAGVLFTSDGRMKTVGDITPYGGEAFDGYLEYEQV